MTSAAPAAQPNRFSDIPGDLSRQLAPWECKRRGRLDRKGRPLPALFELQEAIHFRSDVLGGTVTVPAGFLSDLASIPQFAWSIFMASDDPRIELGGWVHDLLYQCKGNLGKAFAPGNSPNIRGAFYSRGNLYTREMADRVLAFEAMPELMATPFQQKAVYRALRWFGDRW